METLFGQMSPQQIVIAVIVLLLVVFVGIGILKRVLRCVAGLVVILVIVGIGYLIISATT